MGPESFPHYIIECIFKNLISKKEKKTMEMNGARWQPGSIDTKWITLKGEL